MHAQLETAVLPAGELALAGHARQAAAAVAAVVVKYFPAAQSLHRSLPVTILYLPATHAVHHVSPLGPEYPALQEHMYDA